MSVVISISVIGVFHLSLWLTCFVVVLSRLEPKLILPRKNINLLLRKMFFLFSCLSLTFFSKQDQKWSIDAICCFSNLDFGLRTLDFKLRTLNFVLRTLD